MKRTKEITSITLAHINDTHSYFEPTSLQLSLNIHDHPLTPFVSAGGFARIATRIHQLRTDAQRMKRGFIFVHAGDCFQGTLYFSLFKGKANAEMLNALGIDAMTLGNHELDMGNEPVAQFAKRIHFPLLAGNWDLSQERQDKQYRLSSNPQVYAFDPEQQCARWIVKEVDNSQVAIFGLSLDKMEEIANPDADTPFVSSLNTARKTVEAIQQSGINKIILVSHLGYEADKELASKVDGISLIVGGHSHILQGDFSALGLSKEEPYGQWVSGTYVVQAGLYALALGHCHIDFDKEGRVVSFAGRNELLLGRRLFLDASMSEAGSDSAHLDACEYVNNHPNVVVCKKDPDVHGILQNKYIPRVRELQHQVIAHASGKLRHVRIPDENGPSQLAPLVAEAFTYAMEKRGYQVQFAIHNAGGVRTSLLPGAVSVADIAGKLLPFAVPIGVYKISGYALAQTLEGAINNALNNGVEGTGSGSYPYTHNLSFDYQADNPIGERIQNLAIFIDGAWHSVNAEGNYYGTSSAYTMKGKEGYHALTAMKGEGKVTNVSMADAFIELLTDKPYLLTQTAQNQAVTQSN
ncbi:bifunctional metallophosphatase/5'-nucleotidase [Vibrio cincinnatiensis]|jgi:5'-nucleotidase|uniref:bifunctional metallophosphatase/5'-nucleotidase n=1 Tax=Vibrio cincinnatiensis TaxID=675 RepID=UPI001302D658|nr:bifunctional UDP-sugar hydrolase/5'-nucleotidase [Vibrio cincinnatiensis]MCG3735532.1 bifunctional metallophosphatase/5'-nucleotidase [Vibrio cincinnatiensis]MCG3746901.1 bifunctional metallophosphatase/5'-nucleotidase [Vibrio cincinnatiensis]